MHFRLLDTDFSPVLPFFTEIKILVSRNDVLHSWAVPRLRVKVDAIPGRISQLRFNSLLTGMFYGQCSEICGSNHRFMPIRLEFVRSRDFLQWVEATKE